MNVLMLATVAVSSYTATIQTDVDNTVVLKALNENLETQACIVAARDGVIAAKALIQANDENFFEFNQTLTCNGQTLGQFAKQFLFEDSNQANETFKVKASDLNLESQLCVDALVIGENQARKKYGLLSQDILCNNKSLNKFVRSFDNKQVVVQSQSATDITE